MAIYENLTTFFGKTVKDFEKSGDITDFATTVPRIRVGYEDAPQTYDERLVTLLNEPGAAKLEALVLGAWNGEDSETSPQEILEILVTSKSKLPNLKALFVGDIVSEENEISWITQGDLSSLWAAFPNLEVLYARGGNGLRLGKINHENLKKLVVQTGGMPATLVREALDTNAPLEHLELWLGTDEYGGTSGVRDFTDLLDGKLFPNLKYLGLTNCSYADALAEALAASNIIDRIETLDLSKGTLSDQGAGALLNSGKLQGLKKLDIEHHYVSEDMVAKLKGAVAELNAADRQELEDYGPFVAVSE